MAELLQAMDVVVREALGRQPVEVIRAEVAVRDAIPQDVIGRHQDAVPHRDRPPKRNLYTVRQLFPGHTAQARTTHLNSFARRRGSRRSARSRRASQGTPAAAECHPGCARGSVPSAGDDF